MTQQQSSPADLEEYNYYLSVFTALNIVLLLLSAAYFNRYQGFPLAGATWAFGGLGLFASWAWSLKTFPLLDRRAKPLSLNAKKATLIVCFILYVAEAALLSMWGGGRQSGAANLLVLAAALSVYVAREDLTKVVVAIIAVLSYTVIAICWFDSTNGQMIYFRYEPGTWLDIAIIIVIVGITYVASRDIEARRQPVSRDVAPTD